MRLRDVRNSSIPPRYLPGSSLFQTRNTVAALVLLGLIGSGVFLYRKSASAAVLTDPATLCRVDSAPPEVVVVLLDLSDRLSEPQRIQVQNRVARLRDSVERFGEIILYVVDTAAVRLREPVLSLCNPGDGQDMNSLYQNPALARRKWQSFSSVLEREIGQLIDSHGSASSPILEAIQSTALRTFARPRYDSATKRLVIVSDLLQHLPGDLSLYASIPSFEQFRSSSYYSRVRARLDGVSVFVYYLVRPDIGTQGKEHLSFWESYFFSLGASVAGVEHFYGDR